MSKFVHLHTHSHYSLLDGLNKIDELVKTAKKFDMGALALTDHGAMYGAIDFYMACKKEDIKPIIGVEAYVAPRSRRDKDPNIDNKRYHLTLLAENETGYKNLIKLVTRAHLEGFYYKPRMDKEILRQYHEGIICLSGCPASELGHALRANDMTRGREIVKEFIDIFGKENYYLEIMHHPEVEGNDPWKECVRALAKEFDLGIVGTQDSHYLHTEDKEAHNTLIAINTGADGAGNEGMKGLDGDYSFIDPKTAEKFFADMPGAVENTVKIAERCNLEITIGKFIFPVFPIPEGKTPDSLLRELAEKGLEVRGLAQSEPTRTRLEYELDIIKFKGYASYFLVVEDLIRYASEHDIYTNIRGSVAGSMTTYLLGITKVDPLEYKIPFERFLNPERPSAPDIDMDFADDRRDEVIEYTKKKYGEDKVAQIGTFGTMMARGAVRDVARALGYPYGVGDRLAKMIPMGSQGFPMTIDHALEMVPELRAAKDAERETREILDLAQKLEGGARHISVHAAGVVIAPQDLTEYVPLQFDPKGGKLITQYDMYSVGEEGIGLTKFDFLGIRNLSILRDAVHLVAKIYGDKIDIEKIPLDDAKTFAILSRGETEGLFQLNGSGMTRHLKDLKPETIHDINAMVALYRPGPMQFIPDFIERKHNPALVSYLDPALEKILEQTYGVLVYQDDLLIMAHDLAGYSWGEVDKFRKAVGKKIPAEMAKQKEKFIEGCMAHSGWSEKKATEIWTWIEPFAAYGFNKAHSASYGRVAYQTAYMKANFPVAYMCACLSAESGDVEQIGIYINECKRMNITVLPPDINQSFGGFTVVAEEGKDIKESRAIRFGFYTIKNLGTDISDAIVAERKKNGAFLSLTDFLERVTHKNLNKKSLEALIKSGSMDAFGERGLLLGNIELLLSFSRESQKNESQDSLFGGLANKFSSSLNLAEAPAANHEEKLVWEKELLGLYVSGHPLDRLRERIEKNGTTIRKIKEELENGMPVTFAALVEDVRVVTTKKNERMAFVRLADYTGSIEAVVFPRLFETVREILLPETCIALEGKVTIRNDEKSLMIEKMKKV